MVHNLVRYEPPTGTVTVTFSNDELDLLIDGLLSHLLWATERQNRDMFRQEMTIFQDQEERDFELMERFFSIRSPDTSTYTVMLSDAQRARLSSGLAVLLTAVETRKESGNFTHEERVLLKRRERSALKLSKRLLRL